MFSVVHRAVDPNSEGPFVSSSLVNNNGLGRWTEGQNPRSLGLSCSSVEEAIEIFYHSHRRAIDVLSDPRTFAHLCHLAYSIKNSPPSRIIFGGAGSSGRIAVLAAHDHGSRFKETQIVPWMVGGAEAVCRTGEGAEDDPTELQTFLDQSGHAPLGPRDLVIGISCGASAPSVAAGLKAAHEAGARTALIANNPFALAPAKDVPGLVGGMKAVLQELHGTKDFFPLPALYGAELLSGSTRLNGGSTTWIVAEALFHALCSDKEPLTAIREYQAHLGGNFISEWLRNRPQLVTAIPLFSEALQNEGSQISYIGSKTIGKICVLDASEHPPTFGVPLNRVNAKLPGGWSTILGGFFSEEAAKTLEAAVPISQQDDISGFRIEINHGNGEAYAVAFDCRNPLVAKMIINTLSTAAYAHAGFVEGNIMINMIPSNVKLIERGIRIIEQITSCSAKNAESALRIAILGNDDKGNASFSELAEQATQGVLPKAIELARQL